MSASISTPVCAVVSADAMISTPLVADASVDARRATAASGWQSGISSDVRFAAMIPASCAVVSASPFGRSREPRRGLRRHAHDRARDGAAPLRPACRRRRPSARRRSRRRATGRSSHAHVTVTRAACVEVGEQRRRSTRATSCVAHLVADALDARAAARPAPSSAPRAALRPGPQTSNGLTVSAQSAELLVRAGVLGEDEHAVARVDERRLLRDEVQAVEDRVHEQHVELLVRGDRPREVVGDAAGRSAPAGCRSARSPRRPSARSQRGTRRTPGSPAATDRAVRAA